MSKPQRDQPADPSTIRVEQEGEWYVAIDEMTDIASQGETRAGALSNLAEALMLAEGGGEAIADPDVFLEEEFDIDVADIEDSEPPWLA